MAATTRTRGRPRTQEGDPLTPRQEEVLAAVKELGLSGAARFLGTPKGAVTVHLKLILAKRPWESWPRMKAGRRPKRPQVL